MVKARADTRAELRLGSVRFDNTTKLTYLNHINTHRAVSILSLPVHSLLGKGQSVWEGHLIRGLLEIFFFCNLVIEIRIFFSARLRKS